MDRASFLITRFDRLNEGVTAFAAPSGLADQPAWKEIEKKCFPSKGTCELFFAAFVPAMAMAAERQHLFRLIDATLTQELVTVAIQWARGFTPNPPFPANQPPGEPLLRACIEDQIQSSNVSHLIGIDSVLESGEDFYCYIPDGTGPLVRVCYHSFLVVDQRTSRPVRTNVGSKTSAFGLTIRYLAPAS